MKFSGRFKSRLEANVGIGGCVSRFEPSSRPSRMFCGHGARNRHSDKEKFCIGLNGPKTPKMSERPLKTPQDFPTSKLNTRVRFPSPAPIFNDLARGRISF
jgi:hypothetical protein